MLGWLYRMIIGSFKGCQHKWVVIADIRLAVPDKMDLTSGFQRDLQCEKCGNIKSVTTRG